MQVSNPKMHQIWSPSWCDRAHFTFSKNPSPALALWALHSAYPHFILRCHIWFS